MANKTYSEKLRDPRWQKKRLQILERDGWKCFNCGADDKCLHVHHLKYTGSFPWEAPDDDLQTLCEECHEQSHTAHPVNVKPNSTPSKNWYEIHGIIVKDKPLGDPRSDEFRSKMKSLLKQIEFYQNQIKNAVSKEEEEYYLIILQDYHYRKRDLAKEINMVVMPPKIN